jgi:hypothetical protein
MSDEAMPRRVETRLYRLALALCEHGFNPVLPSNAQPGNWRNSDTGMLVTLTSSGVTAVSVPHPGILSVTIRYDCTVDPAWKTERKLRAGLLRLMVAAGNEPATSPTGCTSTYF